MISFIPWVGKVQTGQTSGGFTVIIPYFFICLALVTIHPFLSHKFFFIPSFLLFLSFPYYPIFFIKFFKSNMDASLEELWKKFYLSEEEKELLA